MDVVAVVGLGYVGLPLAVAYGKNMQTIGYGLCLAKLDSYRRKIDPSGTVSAADLQAAEMLTLTNDASTLSDANILIVAVPTPIDAARHPDFGPLVRASEGIARHMKVGETVIYESTVYPGATEEVCIPVLERVPGLQWKRDFWMGYSPERINPGDKHHTLANTIKVVSGDCPDTLERISVLYEKVVAAGVHRATSLRVAEAAKVIENTQRDLIIALMNELAVIFNKMGLDTLEVLEPAGTKWNFLPRSGGRSLNWRGPLLSDLQGANTGLSLRGDPSRAPHQRQHGQIRHRANGQANDSGWQLHQGRTGECAGYHFQGRCARLAQLQGVGPDHGIAHLRRRGVCARPVTDAGEAMQEYGVELVAWDALPKADAVVLAVAHQAVLAMPTKDICSKLKPGGCFVDVKSQMDVSQFTAAGFNVWKL